MCESISKGRCMMTLPCRHRLDEIEKKLDTVIALLKAANGISVLANLVGNAVDGNK